MPLLAAVRQKKKGGSGQYLVAATQPSPAKLLAHVISHCYFHLTRKYRTLPHHTLLLLSNGLRSPHCAHPLRHRLQICILLLACFPILRSME